MRKFFEKNTSDWRNFSYFSFVTYISIENHSLTWIKEDKPKIKCQFFLGLGSSRLFPKTWGVCMHYWKAYNKLIYFLIYLFFVFSNLFFKYIEKRCRGQRCRRIFAIFLKENITLLTTASPGRHWYPVSEKVQALFLSPN